MNYLRTYLQAHICHFSTICGLALTGICVVMAVRSTERWPMMLDAFFAGANLVNALYIADLIRTRRRIKELTDGCNRLNQASLALRYSLMGDGWEATAERPMRSDYNKPSMH